MFLWEQVAEYLKSRPNGSTRADIASAFDISKSTAIYHLEKCAARGRAVKVYTWAKHGSRGWVYYAKESVNNG